jgi:hypothetical protein
MSRAAAVPVLLAWWSLTTVASDAGSTSPHPIPRVPTTVRSLEVSDLHNVFALSTNVYSGSTPENDAAFAALASLGVRTIISVDGAKPDVEAARRQGIRYVHLPHGYDGITEELQLKLAQASAQLPGAIYVHCHHGKHRGPAAAAILCRSFHGWTASEAEAWLIAAGTSTNYTGLYKVAREFRLPSSGELDEPADFPEATTVSGMVDAMVEIDLRWEHLRAVRAAGYVVPKDHPDLVPANEAGILREHFRELQRLSESARHGTTFMKRLETAEAEAAEAEALLRRFAAEPASEIRAGLDDAFGAIHQSCASCHRAHRD